MTGYEWRPIEDLPEDWRETLASSELAGLFGVWKDHVVTLKDSPAYHEFQARLRREWAIETGIIEGLYEIDRGVTRTLIERGLHASLIAHGDANKPAELIIPMLKDHENVVEGLFDFVGQQRPLSTSYIKQIHQELTAHQETAVGIDQFGNKTEISLLRGEWKIRPNNPTRPDGKEHQFCPPEQTASEMDRLIQMHLAHEAAGVLPEVEAAWLHHRFTQIHPFQDGNGRVARALASIVFIRGNWFPLVINRIDRDKYISSLELADNGDIFPLVNLFARVQKKAFNQAIVSANYVLLDPTSIHQVIGSGIQVLKQRAENKLKLNDELLAVAEKLRNVTRARIQSIASEMQTQLNALDPNYGAHSGYWDSLPEGHKVHGEIGHLSNQLKYNANSKIFGSAELLTINTQIQTQLVVAFHGFSEFEPSILGASAYSKSGGTGLQAICHEAFQCTSKEDEATAIERFKLWLDDALLAGLNQWRRQL